MKSSSLITGSLRLSLSRWQRSTAYKNSNVLEGDLISGSLQWRYRCHNSPTSSWRRRLFCNKKSWSTHDYHQHDHQINGHDHHYHDHHPQHSTPVDVGGRKGLKPGGSPGKEKPGKPCSTSVTNHISLSIITIITTTLVIRLLAHLWEGPKTKEGEDVLLCCRSLWRRWARCCRCEIPATHSEYLFRPKVSFQP